MYEPKRLIPQEVVPKSIYEAAVKANRVNRIFWQFNPYVLMTADMLADRYGSILVNNWHKGGDLNERGLRLDSSSTGELFSAHKRGAALDCNFKNATAEEVRNDMEKYGCFKPGFKSNLNKNNEIFRYINRIECTLKGKSISWFHFDIFNCYNDDGSIMRLNV